MYEVAVRRDFIASHFLTGADWGAENEIHSHHYVVEVRLSGPELDRHGYLVDICEIEDALDAQIEAYRDKTLNLMEAFQGRNPSLERFAAILSDGISGRIRTPPVNSLTVIVWENEAAWASYRKNC